MRFRLFLMSFLFFIFCGCALNYNSGFYRQFYSEIEPNSSLRDDYPVDIVHTANLDIVLERYKKKGYAIIGISDFYSEDPHLSFLSLMLLAREKGAHAVIIKDKYLSSETREEKYTAPHTSPVFSTGNIMHNGKYYGTYNNTSYVTTYSQETRNVTHIKYQHSAYFMRKTIGN